MTTYSRHCLLPMVVAALFVSGLAGAVGEGAAPTVGDTVDPSVAPWTAIGRVNNSIGGNCTGVLVTPDRVLTAAHCVYNERTRRFLRAEAIHVLLGFTRGTYAFHGRAVSYRLAEGYEPGTGTVGRDYAVLTLAQPVPAAIAPLVLARAPAPAGTEVLAVGYGRGRPYVPTVKSGCRIAEVLEADAAVLVVDCVAPDGYSGGPLLAAADPGRVVGLQVARQRAGDAERTLAVSASSISLEPGGRSSP